MYSYVSQAHQTIMEIIVKISDSPLGIYRFCGQSGHLNKEISKTAFQLKGNGWYSSEYEGQSNYIQAANSSASITKIEYSTSDS